MARRTHGLTLVETVLALFLIVACLLVVIRMIFVGADIQRRAAVNERAALIAARHLGRIRTWAQDATNFYNDSNWTTVASGTAVPDPDYPEFSLTISSAWKDVYSPSRDVEARFVGPPDTRRVMTRSYRQVEVLVTWFPAARNRFVLVSLVGAPELPVDHVNVSATTTGPLAHDALANLTISARDGSDNEIPDHFFTWSQSAAAGAGSVGSFQNVTRSGASGQYQNFYRNANFGGSTVPVYGPPGVVNITLAGRSPSILDSGTSRWSVNTTSSVEITNQ